MHGDVYASSKHAYACGGQKAALVSFSIALQLIFDTGSLSEREVLGLRACTRMPDIFKWVLRIELRSSYLSNRHTINGADSPAISPPANALDC